ncbi:MAG: acetolactate decarboxylase [Synergistaceae bacterium]|nr:acetolactate decarboxylase [Synergistaceae bacterium]MBR0035081.1 acetolactate decarboxylase [Synergistaceae bacterium]
MKKFLAVLIVLLSVNAAFAVSDGLFQTALLQSLMQGEYDGVITVKELKTYGDTGIGTFQSVNGELIMLNGIVYRALWDGSVEVAADEDTVPFTNVTFFDADVKKESITAGNIEALKDIMTSAAREAGRNQFYMAKVSGTMPYILVRSELAQKQPYKPLNDALKTDQREFEYKDLRGTVVALYCPDYMGGLNTPGWHLHFISEDGQKGGHVLELSVKDCLLEMDVISEFNMIVPNRPSFNDKDLAVDMHEDIQQVEGGKK